MKKMFVTKRAVVLAFAVLLAVGVSHYYARTEPYWMIITTLLVMQTAIGVALRQGMQRFLIMAGSVIVGTCLVALIKEPLVIDSLAIIFFCAGCYYAVKYSFGHFVFSFAFLGGLTLVLAMLLPNMLPLSLSNKLFAQLHDVTLGAVIGIAVNILVFPSRVDVEFRENMLPLLQSYSAYLTVLIQLLFKKPDANSAAQAQKIAVEKILRMQLMLFPDWVYEAGLSMPLQKGHRHFLAMIERVGQILFSLHYFARQAWDVKLLQTFQGPVFAYVAQVNKVLEALCTVLQLKQLPSGISDLSDEMQELEAVFKAHLPSSLELIDISPQYLSLAAFMQDLQDLRIALLQLATALRSA